MCAKLPLANYTLLRFLSAHLINVINNEALNKMSIRNIAIVFSPTLAIPAAMCTLILENFEAVFDPPLDADDDAEPGTLPLVHRSTADAPEDLRTAKRRSRNSALYAATGVTFIERTLGGGSSETEPCGRDLRSSLF